MTRRRSPHEVLGVRLGASADEIRAARRQLAREHHPDRFMGDPKSAAVATRGGGDGDQGGVTRCLICRAALV